MQYNSLDTCILRYAAEQSNPDSTCSELLKSDYILVDVVISEADKIICRYKTIQKNIFSIKPSSIKISEVIDKLLSGIPNLNDECAIEKIALEEAKKLGLKTHANPDQAKELQRNIADRLRRIVRKMLSYSTISQERIIPFRSDEHFRLFSAIKKKLNPKRKDDNTDNDIKIITVSVCYAFNSSCDLILYSNDKFINSASSNMISETLKTIKPEHEHSQVDFKIKTLV